MMNFRWLTDEQSITRPPRIEDVQTIPLPDTVVEGADGGELVPRHEALLSAKEAEFQILTVQLEDVDVVAHVTVHADVPAYKQGALDEMPVINLLPARHVVSGNAATAAVGFETGT